MVVVKTTFLPNLSPIIPKIMPPTGLNKNAIANVANVNIVFSWSFSTELKKFCPKITAK